jgi:hypothetical protein
VSATDPLAQQLVDMDNDVELEEREHADRQQERVREYAEQHHARLREHSFRPPARLSDEYLIGLAGSDEHVWPSEVRG